MPNKETRVIKPAKAVPCPRCDRRIDSLNERVEELREMVVYLARNPHVRVDDYLKGKSYVA